MSRPFLMSALIAAAVTLPACQLDVSNHGSVSERGGILFADDVPLDHHREVALTAPFNGLDLRFATHTGDIDIRGVEGGEVDLVIDLFTEYEGDGEVRLEDGRLKTRSALKGRLLINGIRGTVPADSSLHVHSGTGRIVLRSLSGKGDLDVDTGTGGVFVEASECGRISLSSGTGSMRLDDVTADALHVTNGTGAFIAQSCRLREVVGDSGTGNFSLVSSHVDHVRVRSGTGNLRIEDSVVGDLEPSLGTGDVITLGFDARD